MHIFIPEIRPDRSLWSMRPHVREALLDAIQNGDFYASQGPKIYSIAVEDDRIHLKCSPEVKTVVFNSYMPWAAERVQEVTDGEAFYRYSEQDRYIRIELLDQEGRMAWSSPYPVR